MNLCSITGRVKVYTVFREQKAIENNVMEYVKGEVSREFDVIWKPKNVFLSTETRK